MKILYYFKDQDTPMYRWQHSHIIDELKRHNCYICVFNPLKYDNYDQANEQLLKYIETNMVDCFMTPHISSEIYIDTIKQINHLGIPTVLYCCDSMMTPNRHVDIMKYFDAVLLSQHDKHNFFRKINNNIIYFPYAANPHLFPSLNAIMETRKICFAGTPYGSRVDKINMLLKHNIEVDLYANISAEPSASKKRGQDTSAHLKTIIDCLRYEEGRQVLKAGIFKFMHSKPLMRGSEHLQIYQSVNFEEMNRIFQSYALSLSISEARNTGILKRPVHVLHLRNFEIPMAGGLQICAYFDDMAECFDEDREIIFYRNELELIDKINFYLSPKQISLRQKIKKMARRRAENEHTWFCRFQKVFDNLGLKYDK